MKVAVRANQVSVVTVGKSDIDVKLEGLLCQIRVLSPGFVRGIAFVQRLKCQAASVKHSYPEY